MSWTRALPTALAVCVLVLTGTASCDSDDGRHKGNEQTAVSPSPVGKVLKDTDEEGRHYREVDDKDAPDVGIEVQPDTDAGWDVRLTVSNFRFSPAGAKPEAVEGRGLVYLYVDGDLVSRLRTPECRIPGDLVPRGTHTVTARLYADDGTVWAVDGDPVESTADITASGTDASPSAGVSPDAEASPDVSASPDAEGSPDASVSPDALSAPGTYVRTGGRGSPDRAGKAS